MFNLLIHGVSGIWERGTAQIGRDRFLVFTHHVLRKRFPADSDDALDALLKFPCLFAYEYGDELPAKVGSISSFRRRSDGFELDIVFDGRVAPIHAADFRRMHNALDITEKFEPYNTHWALKDVDLIKVLKEFSVLLPASPVEPPTSVEAELDAAAAKAPKNVPGGIFVVHGRQEALKNAVARWIEGIGLEAIILSERASGGRTVIEKFEAESDRAQFAVVLLTPDDVGGLSGLAQGPRARQNVVFELGYFVAKIGRQRVIALVEGDVEIPSDYAGVVYIRYDGGEGWKIEVAREFARAGLQFNHKVF